jgi:hypothetical protein
LKETEREISGARFCHVKVAKNTDVSTSLHSLNMYQNAFIIILVIIKNTQNEMIKKKKKIKCNFHEKLFLLFGTRYFVEYFWSRYKFSKMIIAIKYVKFLVTMPNSFNTVQNIYINTKEK